MVDRAKPSPASIRTLALLGVLGPPLFVLGVVAAGLQYPGYSHVSQVISELGGAEAGRPIVQNLNFLLIGVATLGFAWSLGAATDNVTAGPKFIAVFALSSLIANGLLPCDAGCQGATTIGLLHNLTGMAGFVAAIVGMTLLARSWRADLRWQAHARFTWAMAVVASMGLATFVAMKAAGAESFDGLAQRLFVGALLTWIMMTAIRTRALVDPS